MHPILGRYGPFIFYSYTFLLSLGLLLSVGLVAYRVRRRPATRPAGWLDGIVAGLLPALLTGRAGYVLVNWDYFRTHLNESWRLWQGGLSYHAALLGGVLGVALWCRRQGCSLPAYADLLAPAAALWSAFGWAACWLEGCAYGRETFLGPLAADLPDNFGVYAVRYQTQVTGLAFSLLALALFWLWRQKLPPGAGFWLVATILSGSRALVSLYRADLQPLLGPVTVTTIVDTFLATFSLAGLLVTYHFRSPRQRVASQTKSIE